MGVERARVTEVHAATSASGRAGSGYLLTERLVLTAGAVAGRRGSTDVRPAGTGSWLPASLVWTSARGDAALLQVDDDAALFTAPAPPRWGDLRGDRPVGVTAIGFPPAESRPQWARDPEQLVAHVTPSGSPTLAVAAGRPVGDGMCGAALFAGPNLVGVLVLNGGRMVAVPAAPLVGDEVFARLVGGDSGVAVVPVSTAASVFPILHRP